MLSENKSLTYAELGERVHCLSECLKSFGVEAEVPVALLLNRSPNQVIAIYAILEAGGFYVPLDPYWPTERKLGIIEDSNSCHILTVSELIRTVPKEFKGRVLRLDDMPSHAIRYSQNKHAKPNNPIYCLYTSGSTGKPKGVIVEHMAVVKRMHYMQVRSLRHVLYLHIIL